LRCLQGGSGTAGVRAGDEASKTAESGETRQTTGRAGCSSFGSGATQYRGRIRYGAFRSTSKLTGPMASPNDYFL
jgi:heat shock protein HslJ